MKSTIRLFSLLPLVLTFFATSVGQLVVADEVYSAGTVYYEGTISADRNRQFFRSNRGRPVERLVIRDLEINDLPI